MDRKIKRIVNLIVLLSCITAAVPAGAQIVSDISGSIELRLNPFFETDPGSGGPTTSQIENIPVGFQSVSASIDGSGFYSAGGLSAVEYEYTALGSAQASLNFRATADSLDAGDGAGGKAALQMQITFSQPVRYRFQAEVIGAPVRYEVSFNGLGANAWYDAMGIYGGSFPPVYHFGNPMPDGWDIYVDQGILSAGTYELSLASYASLHRYGIGIGSEGTANLLIQLLGDTDMDGYVGVNDLNTVMSNWNNDVTPRDTYAGDLTGDGFVGINDLNAVLGSWNADVRPPATAASIPEPATGGILIAFILAWTHRKPRHRH